MTPTGAFTRVADQLRKEIEGEISSVGIFCRVFARGKSPKSIEEKLNKDPGKYRLERRLIQDSIGIRVVLYFQEDIEIVEAALRAKYEVVDSSTMIDTLDNSTFSVARHNLVFRLPDCYYRDVPPPSVTNLVDRAFEVQLRTILSEGWHEVEHDLRYKRIDDWDGHNDLSRGLNGVVATLETAEWSMRKIFDELAYRHYKGKRWDAMVHSALRLRLSAPLSREVAACFDGSKELARGVLRINRATLVNRLLSLAPRLPTSADNIVFVWNLSTIKDGSLDSLTPRIVRETYYSSCSNGS